jgi:eukaryotic-like serine/threonine-protein kinase
MTGHLFGDRYQVGDTLGFGGMSEVHRGRDLRLGRDVAIKVLRADLARDPSFQTRFRREAQNAASLNHPAIVAVYDTGETLGETGPIPYIVMEYVDGETLRDLLKREGPLAPKRAMEIVADVCAALDFSHRHGIVHRDIKPANVMLTRAGAVKVMDFGIARAVADGQSTMTATAAVIGTAQYLSPEQARGEAVDARSDVYATGCVLFELITGSPPFTGDSPVAVAYQHVREDPKAPSEVKPGLPKELDAIVLKALNKNPLNRYQTAAEMRSDLVRALSGQAVHATPVLTEEERTQLLRPGPVRVGVGAGTPPLLAPPHRSLPEDMWEEEAPARSNKRVWGFVGVGVLCAVLLAGAIFFVFKVANGNKAPVTVIVPSFAGQTQTNAISSINNSKLTVGSISNQPSSNDDLGKVISQNPSEKSQVDAGTKVDLVIGAGVTKVVVPDLDTLTVDQARAKLQALNLTANIVQKESSDADKDKVIGQNPGANANVDPQTQVTVTVGSGTKKQKIPGDLIGKSFDQAAAELKALNINAVPQEADSEQPKDVVLAMPGYTANQTVPENTTLVLTVSKNNQFLMPNLQNKPFDDAVNALKQAGWNGTPTQVNVPVFQPGQVGVVTAQNGNGLPAACVNGQDPPAGTKLLKVGPAITLCVGQKATISIPNLQGQTQQAAFDQLTGLGFTNVSAADAGVAPTTDLAGKVAGTNPQSGEVVPYDTAITVGVYKAAPTTPTTPTSGTGGAPVTPVTPTTPTTPTSPAPPGGNTGG